VQHPLHSSEHSLEHFVRVHVSVSLGDGASGQGTRTRRNAKDVEGEARRSLGRRVRAEVADRASRWRAGRARGDAQVGLAAACMRSTRRRVGQARDGARAEL
jgi:hypothetical protein